MESKMAQEIQANMAKAPKLESEEEEEEEEFVISKPKATVKFVVEAEDIVKSPLSFELKSEKSANREITNGIFESKNLDNEAEVSIDQTLIKVDRSPEIRLSEELEKKPESAHEAIVSRIAEKFVCEAMHKAYQDLANTELLADHKPISQTDNHLSGDVTGQIDQSRKPQQVICYEDKAVSNGTPYLVSQTQPCGLHQGPVQISGIARESGPQQSPIKVQLHENQGAPAPRPEWSVPVQFSHDDQHQHAPQEAPKPAQRLIANKGSVKPISHQKLADQVAQKAIINYQSQQNRVRFPKPIGQPQYAAEPRQDISIGGEMQFSQTEAEETNPYATSEAYQRPDQFTQQRSSAPQASEYVAQQRDAQAYQQRFTASANQPANIGAESAQRSARPLEIGETWQKDDKKYKWNKIYEPTSWVMQESVTANQLVKGAPWARHGIEKQHRAWPPPPPKMCLVVKEEPSFTYAGATSNGAYTSESVGQHYERETNVSEPYTQAVATSFCRSDVRGQAGDGRSISPRPYQGPIPSQAVHRQAEQQLAIRQPDQRVASGRTDQQIGSRQADQQFIGGQQFPRPFSPVPKLFEQQFVSRVQPPTSRQANQQDSNAQFRSTGESTTIQPQLPIQQYGPVRPAIFNPYSTAKYATPVVTTQQKQQYHKTVPPAAAARDLSQPLTLDTAQSEGSYYHQEQKSPRMLYKATAYSPDDVTRAVPPAKPTTCTPILPFTKQLDQQDFDKFQDQYSPVKMATGQYIMPESHQFVKNQVTSIPGGTSFARVQNVAQVNYDPETGQPYKENITRVVRTSRTVPKWK